MKLIMKAIPDRQEKKYALKCWLKENPQEKRMQYTDFQDWHFIYNDKKEIVGSTCSTNLFGDVSLQTVYVYRRHRGQGYMAKIIETINPNMIELGFYEEGSIEHKKNMQKFAELGYTEHLFAFAGNKMVGETVARKGWRPNPMFTILPDVALVPKPIIDNFKINNRIDNVSYKEVKEAISRYYDEV